MMDSMRDDQKWGATDYGVAFFFATAVIYGLITATEIWWR